MNCVLIRHGMAVERDEWEGADAGRPLTDDGVKRVRQVAAGLQWLDVQPTLILSSPLTRAIETARILGDTMHFRNPVRYVEVLSPDAVPDRLLSLLQDLPSESCVFCVGHEPQLGLTAGVMLAGTPAQAFRFKKAGACMIEFSLPVEAGQGALKWWMEPGQLRALGKKTRA